MVRSSWLSRSFLALVSLAMVSTAVSCGDGDDEPAIGASSQASSPADGGLSGGIDRAGLPRKQRVPQLRRRRDTQLEYTGPVSGFGGCD